MSDDMKNVNANDRPPLRAQNVPQNITKRHAEKITEEARKDSSAAAGKGGDDSQYSLNDDRRVKTLSPGALVAKRFFRNRVAVTGMVILIAMFVFSFIGGAITPYKEDQLFYRIEAQNKQYASVVENKEFRYSSPEGEKFSSLAQSQFMLAYINGKDTFESGGESYYYTQGGENFYVIYHSSDSSVAALAAYDVVSSSDGSSKPAFEVQLQALHAYYSETKTFTIGADNYEVLEDGAVLKNGEEIAYVSHYIVQGVMQDVTFTRQFKDELISEIQAGKTEFNFTDTDGVQYTYTLKFDAARNAWNVMQSTETRVYDTYGSPSREHPLGTDRNGMDMITRLMYGGRVSLYIGFIVIIIETTIGVIMGGISGYFGSWVDMLIMRIVDIFYCIPSMPIIIILGATMDAMKVDPQIRMIYLMLILGFLGWPGIARMVRGQILSLREQEFMTATEATGIRVSRRIFKHLIPNVIPQLIVIMTMSLGDTILMEATLSFLGLGVKFPFASWGNIINDVNDTFVLTNYWFIWIPAGICLLLTVLAFNLVGDGLRDAFDPKMKR